MLPQSVRLQPDEMLSSWLDEVKEMNRLDKETTVLLMTGKPGSLRAHGKGYPTCLDSLYDGICRQGRVEADIPDIIRDNTLYFTELPFLKSGQQAHMLEFTLRGAGKRTLTIRPPSADMDMKICPVCAVEDRERFGRAYVHVPHQVPGVDACYKHGCSLVPAELLGHLQEPQEAPKTEKEIAEFFYNLYVEPVDMDDRIRSFAVNEALKGLGEGETFQTFLEKNRELIHCDSSPKGWYSLTTNSKFRFLALVFDCDPDRFREMVKACSDEEEKAEKLQEITKDYGLLDEYGPVVWLRCRKCGTIFHTHREMISLGAGCPACDEKLPAAEIRDRYVRCHGDGNYVLDGNEPKRIRIIHRPCGTEVKSPLSEFIFRSGDCPVCAAQSKVGETSVNSDGQKMTIITYESSRDIDVQFEDGTVVRHRTYCGFRRGTIANPNNNPSSRKVGLEGMSVIGMKMKITAYRGCGDVDVSFEDGTVVTGQKFYKFLSGHILRPCDWKNRKIVVPVIPGTNIYDYSVRVGETNRANNGQMMKIIAYRNASDIDVEFEDGTVVSGVTYSHFKEGRVRNRSYVAAKPPVPKEKKEPISRIWDDRVGEESLSKDGQLMKIIAYRGFDDIDVEFEDGTVVPGKKYERFLNGHIRNPNFFVSRHREEREGETRMSKYGMKMTIIRYGSAKDIDVRFESGAVVEHTSYGAFVNDNIKDPAREPRELRERWLGQVKTARNGMEMEVISCRKFDDADIRFEDGTVIEHVSLKHFLDGSIRHPGLPNPQRMTERVGETAVAGCGQIMTITAYRGANDIDIQFEDGVVVEHKSYANFKDGNIHHPGTPKTRQEPVPVTDRTGEIGTASDGSKIVIVAFRGYDDIDIRFEDGTVSEHRQYMQFKRGEIKNPSAPHGLSKSHKRVGETRTMKNGLSAVIIAYRNNKDADIRFENGVIREHMNYANFQRGDISDKAR